MPTKVRILTKAVSDGKLSIYLDFYLPIKHPKTGKSTRREFLKLYLYDTEQQVEEQYIDKNGKQQTRFVKVLDSSSKPKQVRLTPREKQYNKQTMALAESIRSERQLDIQAGQMGFLSKEILNMDFVVYFEQLARKRKGSSFEAWRSAILVFKDFLNGNSVKISQLDKELCNDYRDYLINREGLKNNTKVAYFGKFKAALRQAYVDDITDVNLADKVKAIPLENTYPESLTLDELRHLSTVDCEIPRYKDAAMFSALTGLRHSDVVGLKWSDVRKDDDGWTIRYRQQKTKRAEILPISEVAYGFLGERGDDNDVVFAEITLKGDYYYNKVLKQWIQAAGITRKITFHCFRHTFATLLHNSGQSESIISKMLGHRNLATTQRYIKVLDKTKRNAANVITLE